MLFLESHGNMFFMMKITLQQEKSVVCYDIYQYKMKCGFEEKNLSKESLIQKLKHSILTQKKMLNYILMLHVFTDACLIYNFVVHTCT